MSHAQAQAHVHVEPRDLPLSTAADAPPEWAVFVVKFCVMGLLLLPVTTLLWALMYTPTPEVDFTPVTFVTSILLGLGLFGTAAYITTTYPPVPTDEKD
jgi:hypothetical protein